MKYIDRNKYFGFNFYGSISYYLRIIFNKVFYIFLILLSLYILIQQKNNKYFGDRVREKVILFSTPQIIVIKYVDLIINKFNVTINFFSETYKVNKILKQINLNLKIKLLSSNILAEENMELKNILNFVSKNYITSYTVKKINIINKDNFVNKLQIIINENDNINENDVVIDENGNFVGRVIDVKNNVAYVLLLTDITSKIPAKLGNSKIKVLLEGNENKNLSINYFLGEKFNISENELVYTSNDGNILQEGILIGSVVKKKNKFEVKISANLNKINYVVILHNIESHNLKSQNLESYE